MPAVVVVVVVVNESVDEVSEEKRTTESDHQPCEENHTCSRCGLTIYIILFEYTHIHILLRSLCHQYTCKLARNDNIVDLP